MSANRLKLYVDKTQFIRLGPVGQLQAISGVQLTVGDVSVALEPTVIDFGLTFDAQHNNPVCGHRTELCAAASISSVNCDLPIVAVTDALRSLILVFITSCCRQCLTTLYSRIILDSVSSNKRRDCFVVAQRCAQHTNLDMHHAARSLLGDGVIPALIWPWSSSPGKMRKARQFGIPPLLTYLLLKD